MPARKRPELSLVLAVEAADWSRASARSERCGRSLLDSRVRAVVDVGEALLAARSQGKQLIAVTEGGELVRANPTTGEVVSRFATGVAADDASFADDGTALITGSDGRMRLVVRRRRDSGSCLAATSARRDDLGGRVACGW